MHDNNTIFFKIIHTKTESRNIPLANITDKSVQCYWEAPIL